MFKKLKQWYRDERMFYYMCLDYRKDECQMMKERFEGTLRFTIIYFYNIIKAAAGYHLICKRKGHNWDVHTNCGPDTGYETFDCKRCGLSDEVTYY